LRRDHPSAWALQHAMITDASTGLAQASLSSWKDLSRRPLRIPVGKILPG
jgi:hypothetical protein